MNNISSNNNYQSYGIIKRSNSNLKKEDRPSTAPSKESKEVKPSVPYNKYIQSNQHNRLPSPQIKSKFNIF
jgi:hypothetical protein